MSSLSRRFPPVILGLPDWVESELPPLRHRFQCLEERMDLVLKLAYLNISHETGGPFAAAIFDLDDGSLIAPGVNVVVPANASIAHAEMMAMTMAQARLKTHDLGSVGKRGAQLVSSVAPCAMCLGAVPWSGVRSLVCGARGDDAHAIGFDEGDKPADWVSGLEARGIRVTNDLMRDAAVAVLQKYQQTGGAVYNGRAVD